MFMLQFDIKKNQEIQKIWQLICHSFVLNLKPINFLIMTIDG